MEKTKPGGPVNNKKKPASRGSLYFLSAVGGLYVVLSLFDLSTTMNSLNSAVKLFLRILPVLALVIFFMAVMRYFIKPKMVSKYVGRGAGIKGWLLAIVTGLLSHGPIYVWYPLLKELKEQGMSNGLVAVFLYNRAVKIPLLPMMVACFGLKIVVILLLYMFAASLIQGAVVNMIVEDTS